MEAPPLSIEAERAAAAERRAASLLEGRARYLRDDAIRMQRRLVREDLEELARLTWAHWTDEQVEVVVTRALEMGPGEGDRPEERDEMPQTERVRILQEGIRAELEKDPKLSAAAIAERLEHRGIQVPPKSTFAPYCSAVRKKLGIQGAPGGSPRRNGKRRAAVQPRTAEAKAVEPDRRNQEAAPPVDPPAPAEPEGDAPSAAAENDPAPPSAAKPGPEPAEPPAAPVTRAPRSRVSLEVLRFEDGSYSLRATGPLEWIQRMVAAMSAEAA